MKSLMARLGIFILGLTESYKFLIGCSIFLWLLAIGLPIAAAVALQDLGAGIVLGVGYSIAMTIDTVIITDRVKELKQKAKIVAGASS